MPQTAVEQNAASQLRSIINQASRELAYRDHVAAGGIETGRTQRAAATAGFLDLRDLSLPRAPDSEMVRNLAVIETPVGNVTPLAAAIVQNSLVARAGARIVICAERPAPTVGDILVTYRDAGAFAIVEAAQFASVADGDSAASSPLPIHTENISWPDAPSSAFSTTISRRQKKDCGFDVEAALLSAIVAGLAQEADRILLTAIAAKVPTAFTLAKAAARGLEFGELRSMIGTAGAGAVVGADGMLRAAGVAGELTGQTAATVVGSFARAAVAVHPTINVLAERLNQQGDTKITVFANMIGLVPDVSAFWQVGA